MVSFSYECSNVSFLFNDRVYVDGDRSIVAIVIGVAVLYHNRIEIQIRWFSNGRYQTAWVEASRLNLF